MREDAERTTGTGLHCLLLLLLSPQLTSRTSTNSFYSRATSSATPIPSSPLLSPLLSSTPALPKSSQPNRPVISSASSTILIERLTLTAPRQKRLYFHAKGISQSTPVLNWDRRSLPQNWNTSILALFLTQS